MQPEADLRQAEAALSALHERRTRWAPFGYPSRERREGLAALIESTEAVANGAAAFEAKLRDWIARGQLLRVGREPRRHFAKMQMDFMRDYPPDFLLTVSVDFPDLSGRASHSVSLGAVSSANCIALLDKITELRKERSMKATARPIRVLSPDEMSPFGRWMLEVLAGTQEPPPWDREAFYREHPNAPADLDEVGAETWLSRRRWLDTEIE